MRYQVPARSGMTTSKRIRAVAPALLIFVAFLGFVAAVNGARPIRLTKTMDSKFPMKTIFWGLDRMVSSGVPIPFYDDGQRANQPGQPTTPPSLVKPDRPGEQPPNVDEMIERWRRLGPEKPR